MNHALLALVLALAPLGACSKDEPDERPFPENYESLYTELRDCRTSGDHQLNKMRVLVSPTGVDAYRDRNVPFPEGAVVLKVEYDFADGSCSEAPVGWTVMAKTEATTDLGWVWHRVDADGSLAPDETESCVKCHTSCGVAPDGYDGTCTLP